MTNRIIIGVVASSLVLGGAFAFSHHGGSAAAKGVSTHQPSITIPGTGLTVSGSGISTVAGRIGGTSSTGTATATGTGTNGNGNGGTTTTTTPPTSPPPFHRPPPGEIVGTFPVLADPGTGSGSTTPTTNPPNDPGCHPTAHHLCP